MQLSQPQSQLKSRVGIHAACLSRKATCVRSVSRPLHCLFNQQYVMLQKSQPQRL